MRRPKARSTPLVGRAPLGSLPAESGQSAATSKHDYSVGDVVFWSTPTTAGEYSFIGHPKGDRTGKILVLALGADIGFEVDADAGPRISSAVFQESSGWAGRQSLGPAIRQSALAHGFGACLCCHQIPIA